MSQCGKRAPATTIQHVVFSVRASAGALHRRGVEAARPPQADPHHQPRHRRPHRFWNFCLLRIPALLLSLLFWSEVIEIKQVIYPRGRRRMWIWRWMLLGGRFLGTRGGIGLALPGPIALSISAPLLLRSSLDYFFRFCSFELIIESIND